MDTMPYMSWPIGWEGDGPTVGAGASDSDAYYGESEAVVAAVSVQPLRAFTVPFAPTFIDQTPLMMTASPNGYDDLVVQTPLVAPTPGTTYAAYQDIMVATPFGMPADVALGAPDVYYGGN